MPVNVALLGSGVFAKMAYLPGLSASTSDVNLHTIWSRSSKSANSLHEEATKDSSLNKDIKIQFGDEGFQAVLDNKEIDAVVIVLPITAQPDLVIKALKAGKHVISEKPLHKDVESARALVEEYERDYKPKGLIWRVAENFAHDPAIRKAAKLVRNPKLGPVLYWQLKNENTVIDGDTWISTSWRTIPDYQGGFILDGGVHQAALLRCILPTPPSSIISSSTLHRNHLPPHDTVTAIALPSSQDHTDPHGEPTKLKALREAKDIPGGLGQSGPTGTILLTWATPQMSAASKTPNGLYITCLNGTLSLTIGAEYKWTLKVSGAEGSGVEELEEPADPALSISEELSMFGRAVKAEKEGQENKEENLGEPRGALWDLALIQACLQSNGKQVVLDELLAGK